MWQASLGDWHRLSLLIRVLISPWSPEHLPPPQAVIGRERRCSFLCSSCLLSSFPESCLSPICWVISEYYFQSPIWGIQKNRCLLGPCCHGFHSQPSISCHLHTLVSHVFSWADSPLPFFFFFLLKSVILVLGDHSSPFPHPFLLFFIWVSFLCP